jgi:hypothetical protein
MVDLVHLVYLVQPNKRDKPDKPNNSLLPLADFISSLLGWEERAPTEDNIGTAEILARLQASQSSWACTPSRRSIP